MPKYQTASHPVNDARKTHSRTEEKSPKAEREVQTVSGGASPTAADSSVNIHYEAEVTIDLPTTLAGADMLEAIVSLATTDKIPVIATSTATNATPTIPIFIDPIPHAHTDELLEPHTAAPHSNYNMTVTITRTNIYLTLQIYQPQTSTSF